MIITLFKSMKIEVNSDFESDFVSFLLIIFFLADFVIASLSVEL